MVTVKLKYVGPGNLWKVQRRKNGKLVKGTTAILPYRDAFFFVKYKDEMTHTDMRELIEN